MKRKITAIKTNYLLVTLVIVLAIVGILLLLNKSDNGIPSGYKELSGFKYFPSGTSQCKALSPSCGVCEGGVIVNEKCYVP